MWSVAFHATIIDKNSPFSSNEHSTIESHCSFFNFRTWLLSLLCTNVLFWTSRNIKTLRWTYLCSLEQCQTTCHWPDTGVWASRWVHSPPCKSTRWSGRRLCHPHGKYGNVQVYLGSHTVPLQCRWNKRGGQGQRCKIVMDFLFSVSVIHTLKVGSPRCGCKMSFEGLKVTLYNMYSSLRDNPLIKTMICCFWPYMYLSLDSDVFLLM